MKNTLFSCALFFFAPSGLHASPELINLSVAAEFSPASLTINNEYVIVLTNENSSNLNVSYGEFGQSVYTFLLSGTSNVNAQSMSIPAHSKVIWHLMPKTVGEFRFVLSDSQTASEIKAALITVVSDETNSSHTKEEVEAPASLSVEEKDPSLTGKKKLSFRTKRP